MTCNSSIGIYIYVFNIRTTWSSTFVNDQLAQDLQYHLNRQSRIDINIWPEFLDALLKRKKERKRKNIPEMNDARGQTSLLEHDPKSFGQLDRLKRWRNFDSFHLRVYREIFCLQTNLTLWDTYHKIYSTMIIKRISMKRVKNINHQSLGTSNMAFMTCKPIGDRLQMRN